MGFIAKQEATFDKYRFGWMSLMIMVQACWASIAAYVAILNDNWVFVTLSAFSAMGSMSMFIAQAKARVCLLGFYISIVLNTLILLACVLLYYI